MASPLITPRFFWITQAGAPAVGYTLQSFAAASATPQATYPTAVDADAGTNANANPLTLDALGSANVFLTQLPYKFVLRDALGAIVWTEDNINQSGVAGFRSGADIMCEAASFSLVDSVQTFIGLVAQGPVVTADPLAEFSTATGRFTAKQAGTYLVMVNAAFNTANGTLRAGLFPKVTIEKNGGVIYTRAAPQVTTSFLTFAAAQKIVVLAAGDFLDAWVLAGWSANGPVACTYTWSIARLY